MNKFEDDFVYTQGYLNGKNYAQKISYNEFDDFEDFEKTSTIDTRLQRELDMLLYHYRNRLLNDADVEKFTASFKDGVNEIKIKLGQ